MVVGSILLHAECGPNDHRKDALPFIKFRLTGNAEVDSAPDFQHVKAGQFVLVALTLISFLTRGCF